jgi:Na+/H+-dicarboxylate symporter
MVLKNKLLPKLIAGIIIGIAVGLISKSLNMFVLVRLFSTFSNIFGNFLSFSIPLIIIGFVAPGIADLGKSAGKLLGITVLMAYASTVIAGLLAFLLGSTVLPKILTAGGQLAEKTDLNLDPYFKLNIPPMMGVMTALVFAFAMGLGMAYIKKQNLLNTFKDFQEVIKLVVQYVIIPFVPVHIAGIFSKLSASGEIFKTIKAFSTVFIMILILQVVYIFLQYLLTWNITGKKPLPAIKNMLPAYFTAVGTQSSAATIPFTLQSAKNNGISDDIADFVIPLCATIHLAGDTITLVLSSMAVMILSGANPTLGVIFPFILMLGVTMVAAPGIPGGGVAAALGLLEGMLGFGSLEQGLMMAIHFSQDSFGTATNIPGDGAIALIIDTITKKKSKGL